MFSKGIRFSLTMVALSPVLVILWAIKIVQNWDHMGFFIRVASVHDVISGLFQILSNHYQLLLFGLLILYAKYLISIALRLLSVVKIDLKSIKPADPNFSTLLFSILSPFLKLTFSGISDTIFMAGFLCICVLYSFIVDSSYHYNLVLKIFLGYKYYEVQTKREVTFMALSKTTIRDPGQLTMCVMLADHMIIQKK